jgi:phosphorylcholine metabolism protein LicD
MNETIVVENLREVKEIFDKHHFRYWLDFGALLGAMRDGKIIEWDHDIDLGTMSNNWEKIVSTIPEFLKRGFCVTLENFKICNNLFRQSIIFERAGFDIAIVIFQTQGEYTLDAGFLPTNRISSRLHSLYTLLITEGLPTMRSRKFKVAHKLQSLLPSQLRKFLTKVVRLMYRASSSKLHLWIIPKHYFDRLGNIKFYGMSFKIPSDVENYLKYHYGEDWKTPKREWIWWEDDGAVRVLKRPFRLSKRDILSIVNEKKRRRNI